MSLGNDQFQAYSAQRLGSLRELELIDFWGLHVVSKISGYTDPSTSCPSPATSIDTSPRDCMAPRVRFHNDIVSYSLRRSQSIAA